MMSRFKEITDKEVQSILDGKSAKNTRRAIDQGRNVFLEYLKTRGKEERDLTTLTDKELDEIFHLMFLSVKKKGGEEMKLNSLKTLRYGIAAYLKEKGFDINSADYSKSQNTYAAVKQNLIKVVSGIYIAFGFE